MNFLDKTKKLKDTLASGGEEVPSDKGRLEAKSDPDHATDYLWVSFDEVQPFFKPFS